MEIEIVSNKGAMAVRIGRFGIGLMRWPWANCGGFWAHFGCFYKRFSWKRMRWFHQVRIMWITVVIFKKQNITWKNEPVR